MAPLKADAPESTDEAPFITSICSIFSTGINSQYGLPASPESIGISSIKIATLLPTPIVKPLPPRNCGSSSRILSPGTKSRMVLILRVFLFSINCG